MGITLRQLTNSIAKVKDYCNRVALHKNMKVLDKLSEENDTLLFDGKPIQGGGGGGSDVSSSTTNGYIVVNGAQVKVYDDSSVRKTASHDNRTVLDKLTVSSDGELLYNNKKVGLNSYRKVETIQINTEENSLIVNLSDLLEEHYVLNNTEILVHNLSALKSSEISIYDKNILLETVTISERESQIYNLGMNSDLIIYGKGNISIKVTMLFTANNNNVTEIQ